MVLAELIQQHPELKVREDSEFFEDRAGKLFIKAKGNNNDTLLQVIFGENQQLITRDIPKAEVNESELRPINLVDEQRSGFRSD